MTLVSPVKGGGTIWKDNGGGSGHFIGKRTRAFRYWRLSCHWTVKQDRCGWCWVTWCRLCHWHSRRSCRTMLQSAPIITSVDAEHLTAVHTLHVWAHHVRLWRRHESLKLQRWDTHWQMSEYEATRHVFSWYKAS
jgi:hypothetical protein